MDSWRTFEVRTCTSTYVGTKEHIVTSLFPYPYSITQRPIDEKNNIRIVGEFFRPSSSGLHFSGAHNSLHTLFFSFILRHASSTSYECTAVVSQACLKSNVVMWRADLPLTVSLI